MTPKEGAGRETPCPGVFVTGPGTIHKASAKWAMLGRADVRNFRLKLETQGIEGLLWAAARPRGQHASNPLATPPRRGRPLCHPHIHPTSSPRPNLPFLCNTRDSEEFASPHTLFFLFFLGPESSRLNDATFSSIKKNIVIRPESSHDSFKLRISMENEESTKALT